MAERRHTPQFVAEIADPAIDLLGYVVVDTNVNGHACGGLRLSLDVSRDLVADLAHGMTLKYGFSGIGQGGAKAGIVGNPDMPGDRKRTLLKRFGELLGPLLRSGYYISGPDMSITHNDIDTLLGAARLKVPRGRRTKGKKSGFFTAMGVMVAIEATAQEKGIDLAKSRIAIEGFGSVGSSLAWLMGHKYGSKVVAVSTTRGALYDSNGLDIGGLFALVAEHGSAVIDQYKGGERIPLEDLLTLDVQVLSPCARPYAINSQNAGKISAPIVVPGANNPVTSEAEFVLLRRGILSVPYFAANCGGVIGNRMEVLGVTDRYIEKYFQVRNAGRIRQLIQRSAATNVPMSVLAEDYAMRRFAETKLNAERFSGMSRLYSAGLHVVRQGWLPEGVLRLMAPVYFERGAERDQSIDTFLS
ncbi:MAG: Glu/Leu/Phe/Val dehydrogenase dimerization domain-containing protein [Bacteroidota bacterium]